MSVDSVKRKEEAKEDISWAGLIKDSEAEIAACQAKIRRLRKSLIFFKKQEASGVGFPAETITRHKKRF